MWHALLRLSLIRNIYRMDTLCARYEWELLPWLNQRTLSIYLAATHRMNYEWNECPSGTRAQMCQPHMQCACCAFSFEHFIHKLCPSIPLGYSLFPSKMNSVGICAVYSWMVWWCSVSQRSVASAVECRSHVFLVIFPSGSTSLAKATIRPQINLFHRVHETTSDLCVQMHWSIFQLECFSWFPLPCQFWCAYIRAFGTN